MLYSYNTYVTPKIKKLKPGRLLRRLKKSKELDSVNQVIYMSTGGMKIYDLDKTNPQWEDYKDSSKTQSTYSDGYYDDYYSWYGGHYLSYENSEEKKEVYIQDVPIQDIQII